MSQYIPSTFKCIMPLFIITLNMGQAIHGLLKTVQYSETWTSSSSISIYTYRLRLFRQRWSSMRLTPSAFLKRRTLSFAKSLLRILHRGRVWLSTGTTWKIHIAATNAKRLMAFLVSIESDENWGCWCSYNLGIEMAILTLCWTLASLRFY